MNAMRRYRPVAATLAVTTVAAARVATAWAQPPEPDLNLPDAAEQSIKKIFPYGDIKKIKPSIRIIRPLEVTVAENEIDRDYLVTPDGAILSIGHKVAPADLPATVHGAFQNLSGSEEVGEPEQVKALAELRTASLTKTRIEYETRLPIDGDEQEVYVQEDGSFIESANKLK